MYIDTYRRATSVCTMYVLRRTICCRHYTITNTNNGMKMKGVKVNFFTVVLSTVLCTVMNFMKFLNFNHYFYNSVLVMVKVDSFVTYYRAMWLNYFTL